MAAVHSLPSSMESSTQQQSQQVSDSPPDYVEPLTLRKDSSGSGSRNNRHETSPAFMSAADAVIAIVPQHSPPPPPSARRPSRLRTPSVSTIRENEAQQHFVVTPVAAIVASSQPIPIAAAKPLRTPPLPSPSSLNLAPPAAAAASPNDQAEAAASADASVAATAVAAAAAAVPSPAAWSSDVALLNAPRPVRLRVWLLLYAFPLLLWASASLLMLIVHYAHGDAFFFAPQAADTSSTWVLVGWIANWISLAGQCTLIGALYRHRSPFFPSITLGSLVSLVVMCVAPIAHSNALLASRVISPAYDFSYSAVQLEWIALLWMLLLTIGLLLQAPRRIPLPLVVALRSKSNLELRAVLRTVQGELAQAQASMHARLYGGNGGGGLTPVGQTEAGYGLNTLARNQLKDILRSTRGQAAFASADQLAAQQPQPSSARSVSNTSGSSNGDAAAKPPQPHRRAHSRRTASLDRATTSIDLAAALAAGGGNGKMTKLDRDMQKFSSAVRAVAAAQQAAESSASPLTAFADAPVPSYMLEPPGSNASGTGSTRSSHRSHKHRRGASTGRRASHSKSKQKDGTGSLKSHRKGHKSSAVADSSSNTVDFFTSARDELAKHPLTIEEQQRLQRRVLEEQKQAEEDQGAVRKSRWV